MNTPSNPIPEISEERLLALASRIKPIVRLKGGEQYEFDPNGELWEVEPTSLRKHDFLSGRPVHKVPGVAAQEIARITTFHTTSSLFNPSVAEVLAQIPEEYADQVVWFETLHEFPQRSKTFGEFPGTTYFEATTVLHKAVDVAEL